MAEVPALLARRRLVTLTGAAGSGKTRLAIEVAATAHGAFADGAVYVPLAAIDDAALVAGSLAAALGVQQGVSESLTTALVAWLRPRRLLLVLDNFEQIVGAAPLVAALLAACPGLTALVTSRVALHLSGEQEYAVLPLAVPASEESAAGDLAQVARFPAVALFVQRAQLVNPEFALTADNAMEMAAICRRLDGLPLALELAAARTRLFSPRALLARLHNRLGLLTDGPRDLPARQQTLRDAIAWSYDLLDAAEQTLFHRLGAFAGGWTLAAAEAVGGDKGGRPVTEALGSLLEKSLARVEARGSGEDRYGMLETLREYAVERLAESGEEKVVRGRHAAYYGSLFRLEWDMAWMTWVEREQENLRAALQWAHDAEEVALELKLAVALFHDWNMSRDLRETRAWLERVRGLDGRYRHLVPPEQRASALGFLGHALWQLGDMERAEALLEEALAVCRAIGWAVGIREGVQRLGWPALARGEFGRATVLFEEYLARAQDAVARTMGREQTGARIDVAWALRELASVALAQGEGARGEALAEQSLVLSRAMGDRGLEGLALNDLGVAAWLRGDMERAAARWAASLALFREVGVAAGAAVVLTNLGRLAALQSQREQARSCFVESLALGQAGRPDVDAGGGGG
jgi:predicted ATPase